MGRYCTGRGIDRERGEKKGIEGKRKRMGEKVGKGEEERNGEEEWM